MTINRKLMTRVLKLATQVNDTRLDFAESIDKASNDIGIVKMLYSGLNFFRKKGA